MEADQVSFESPATPAMGAMDLGENRVLSALSIHEDPSDAEDDLDGFDSEEGEEDEEEIIDVAPNLFECSNINIVNGDELVIENTCSEESCIRSFDSQRDQIEHSKYCPASTTHFAVVRPRSFVQQGEKEMCPYCSELFVLADSLEMHKAARHGL
ncbi:hypothetical protein E5D57_000168 [Metarhizium anisopliae]|nr:hypothetical protein E5D57_000168 [Metarhizium anisopliae]